MNEHFITPDWPVSHDIHAITSLRTGGFSKGSFSTLNLASHVGDNLLSVTKNRSFLREALSLPGEPLWLKQSHRNQVRNAAVAGSKEADASYTRDKGVVCAVLTADCLPVLLCNPDTGSVAAVHAGWRGLLLGVIEATLAELGNKKMAWLGPAIGPDAFEVGDDVRDSFVSKSDCFKPAFRAQSAHKWLADIYAISRIILRQNNVTQIYGGGFCTYSESKRFFSYRREGVTGRMATLIWRQ